VLSIKPTEYTSAIPPRGTQTVVFKVNQNLGGAHPQTTYKAFNWDQTYRKAIIWTAAQDDKSEYAVMAGGRSAQDRRTDRSG
jgi:hypothetical protein